MDVERALPVDVDGLGIGGAALPARYHNSLRAKLGAAANVGQSDVSGFASRRVQDGDEAGIVAFGLYIGEVEIVSQLRRTEGIGAAIDAMPREVHGAFCDDANAIDRGDDHRERMPDAVIGETQIAIDVDGVAALRRYVMGNGRPGRTLEEVLHLHLRRLDGVGIFK